MVRLQQMLAAPQVQEDCVDNGIFVATQCVLLDLPFNVKTKGNLLTLEPRRLGD
jgi:hypothetical protein